MKDDNHKTIPEPRWRKISQWIFSSTLIIMLIANIISRFAYGDPITPWFFTLIVLIGGLGLIIFVIIDYINKFYVKKTEIFWMFLSGIILILIGIGDFMFLY
ncbi:uncharacterized membrane protein YcaP (DUF421 family) [Geomicrobium halophilum]|uniref:Uncharacterized membrane protein YcaP (DUF421 family) n=1 Tax=Geomicrobium halophilum TaxID=549000 RepID=A0A841PT97_9BACL|nr:hypothetical protein [Geomicrobium halophilum]MBB6450994.1 uncharacterized membrane protein YcaP (DUF421 family) [Geomicrobium halophilum]